MLKNKTKKIENAGMGRVLAGFWVFFFNKFVFFSPLFFKDLFLYLFYFLAVVGLNCCPWDFSSYSEPGLLFIAELRLLITLASLGAEHGLWGTRASVVAA